MEAVTNSGTAVLTLPTDEQILITREFDAPKHLVYKAFTTPELVKRWWHAKRGKVTVCEIDLRVGGKWRYVMVADDRALDGLPEEALCNLCVAEPAAAVSSWCKFCAARGSISSEVGAIRLLRRGSRRLRIS